MGMYNLRTGELILGEHTKKIKKPYGQFSNFSKRYKVSEHISYMYRIRPLLGNQKYYTFDNKYIKKSSYNLNSLLKLGAI